MNLLLERLAMAAVANSKIRFTYSATLRPEDYALYRDDAYLDELFSSPLIFSWLRENEIILPSTPIGYACLHAIASINGLVNVKTLATTMLSASVRTDLLHQLQAVMRIAFAQADIEK